MGHTLPEGQVCRWRQAYHCGFQGGALAHRSDAAGCQGEDRLDSFGPREAVRR